MKIYISYPMSLEDKKLQAIIHHAFVGTGNTGKVFWWKKGEPYSKVNQHNKIKECDLFVVVLSHETFRAHVYSITQGVKSELLVATKHQKKIVLAYWNSTQGLGFYDTTITPNGIDGIAGTRDACFVDNKAIQADKAMFDKADAVVKVKRELPVKVKPYDGRLLLTINL